MANPEILFPMMQLETIYCSLLKSDNIHHNNHSTTFTNLVIKNVLVLNKKTANQHVHIFLTLLQLLG